MVLKIWNRYWQLHIGSKETVYLSLIFTIRGKWEDFLLFHFLNMPFFSRTYKSDWIWWRLQTSNGRYFCQIQAWTTFHKSHSDFKRVTTLARHFRQQIKQYVYDFVLKTVYIGAASILIHIFQFKIFFFKIFWRDSFKLLVLLYFIS